MTVSADLHSAFVTQLQAVTSIGLVHPRPRWIADWSKFLNLFKTTIGGRSVIRSWWVRRDLATAGDGEFDVTERVHRMIITGIAGFSDSDAESQYAAMQSLCDTIMARFDSQTTLGVTGVMVDGVGPCSLLSFEHYAYGSVGCHVTEIEVPVRVFLPTGTA